MNKRNLLRLLLLALLLFFALPCIYILTILFSKWSKKDYYSSQELCNNLYVEKYLVFSGGVYGTNTIATYLTDSVNFRMYTGTYFEDDENMSYECKGDTIRVSKISVAHLIKFMAVSTKTYSITFLKRKHKFE